MKNDDEAGERSLKGFPGEVYGALAATFGFYFKAHVAHWNVTGMQFPALHELFGDIYEDAHDAVDAIAEHLRTLDVKVPPELDDLCECSGIKSFTGRESAEAMVKVLIKDNETVIEALGSAYLAANKANEVGISNFLQERLDKHAKWHWQLTATAG